MTLLLDPLALLPAAFLSGVLMFFAPCTLPLVPSYLVFIAGVGEEAVVDSNKERRIDARRTILYNALAFVVGFSLVFIIFGTFAAFLGALLGEWRYALARIAGLILIFFGLMMLGFLRLPFLLGQWQAHIPKSLSLGRPQSSFLIGSLFALGWSPCIGPILGSILFIASVSATAPQGALLLAVFSLGLAIPFLCCALLIQQAQRLITHLTVFSRILTLVGGLILVLLGILMLSNTMGLLITWGYQWFGFLGYSQLLNYL